MKSVFGVNGNKLLKNISHLFSNGFLIYRIDNEVDFTRFELKTNKNTIESSIEQINQQNGTVNIIKSWILENIIPMIKTNAEYIKIKKIITEFHIQGIEDEVDLFLSIWQLLQVKNNMKANFKKACKYLFYLEDKKHFTQTIAKFNPVKRRFDIKPKEEKNSLIVKWPKAIDLSNGQRDILTFITLLIKSKNNFRKKDSILIIDEIFDYLDDANLIAFQYYISTFIDDLKRQKRRIFAILLTHLDPMHFNHFCFSDAKINVQYLKEINIKTSKEILKLIYRRGDDTIRDNVDKYFFHYHPNHKIIDLSKEFNDLKLNVDWAKPESFLKKVFREFRRYLFENTKFDPLAVCFGVRILIEELAYNKIQNEQHKNTFIEQIHGTKNKLQFCESIGLHIPDTYFLLGVIYNNSLHLQEGQDISKALGIKLDNFTIKIMITNLLQELNIKPL